MSSLMTFLLSAHVVLGLLGIAAFYVVWLWLLKPKLHPRARLTAWQGTVALVLSWLTGGYYYAVYYGKAVKPVIIAGKFPWAHRVFMEAKEHIFLFLPFLAAVAAAVLSAYGDALDNRPVLRSAVAWLSGIIVVLGIIITLAGTVISGAVR